MAFNSNDPRMEFVATGSQTDFVFNFKIFATSDIKAYLTPVGNTADDTTDILILTTDYTIVIDGDDGGTLTLVVGATNGDKVTILRDLPFTRTTDYAYGGDLKEATLDADQDYQTYLAQQLEASKSQFLQLPLSLQEVSAILPAPVADAYFKWDSIGTAIENDTTIPDAVVTSTANAAAALLSETNAAASESAAAISETNAAASAASIDPTKLLHTVGNGGGDPEGYTSAEMDTKRQLYAKETTTHDITADADYTLSTAQNLYGRVAITDAGVLLTLARNIIVDTSVRELIVKNDTAQILTFKTSAGTGIEVAVDATVWLYCDGTNVIESVDVSVADTRLNTADEDYTGQAAGVEIRNANAGEWIKNQCTAWASVESVTPSLYSNNNIASVTKTATGEYAVAFLAAMDNINYTVILNAIFSSADVSALNRFAVVKTGSKAVGGFSFYTGYSTESIVATLADVDCDFIVFGGRT
jgi:hypothetical protein